MNHDLHTTTVTATRRRSGVAALVALVLATLALQAVAVAPSGAWATSSRVDLGGKVSCVSPTARVTNVEMWVKRLDDGSETYHVAALDNGRYSRKYSTRLSVPGKGVSVWVRVTCGSLGSYWTGGPTGGHALIVKRPTVGYGTTRHLCPNSFQTCL